MTRLLLVPAGTGDPTVRSAEDDARRWSRALRDAGLEVVLGAPGSSAPAVAVAALQEDVAAVLLTGAAEADVAAVRRELDARGADDVALRSTVGADAGDVTSWAASS